MTRMKLPRWMLIGCFLFLSDLPTIASDTIEHIEKPVRQSIQTRQASQEADAAWRLEKEKLTERFEQLQALQEQLQTQRKDLRQHIQSTQGRIATKEKQLADIEQISSQIQPFLEEMLTLLKTQVSEGYPFLRAEREKRIDNLEHLMIDPDVSVSEKYRKIMEAFLVEAEYCFTVETYQETIVIDDHTMLVDIFRLGRLSLFYQSLDQKRCGFYNVASKAWQPLPASHTPSIHAAIDIAAKRKPVELLTLPVGRMVIP
jgi:benzoyl-CoA reductase/2-hydroxyglutaryl-CoA dehydratase subunit BcrC/BadD/HgdB